MCYFKKSAPGMTRTCGTQIRNLVLYPPELRGRGLVLYQNFTKMQVFCSGISKLEKNLDYAAKRIYKSKFDSLLNYLSGLLVFNDCGDVAQLGERYVRNVQVVGSIPIISTTS